MKQEGRRRAAQGVGCERLGDRLVSPLLVFCQRGRLAVGENASGQRVADDVHFFCAGEAFRLEIAKECGGEAQVTSTGQRQHAFVDEGFEDEGAAKRSRAAVLPEVLDAGEHLGLRRVEPQLAHDLGRDLRTGETIRALQKAPLDQR